MGIGVSAITGKNRQKRPVVDNFKTLTAASITTLHSKLQTPSFIKSVYTTHDTCSVADPSRRARRAGWPRTHFLAPTLDIPRDLSPCTSVANLGDTSPLSSHSCAPAACQFYHRSDPGLGLTFTSTYCTARTNCPGHPNLQLLSPTATSTLNLCTAPNIHPLYSFRSKKRAQTPPSPPPPHPCCRLPPDNPVPPAASPLPL